MTITPLTEEQAHDALLGEYSDAYKAVMGFRPCAETLHKCGNVELYDLVQDLYASSQVEADRLIADREQEAQVLRHGVGPTLMGPLAAALREAI